jgi:hypothetical protein
MKTTLASAIALVLVSLVGACASYDGRGLVPGQSTTAQVEALMGRPAERLSTAAGETVWFYPHAPAGRDTYAVRMRADGVLISVEQRLTKENVARVVPGKTTPQEVRELFGPPWQVSRAPLTQREVWDYPMLVDNKLMNFYVQIADGIVREAYLLHDPVYDAPDGGRAALPGEPAA